MYYEKNRILFWLSDFIRINLPLLIISVACPEILQLADVK